MLLLVYLSLFLSFLFNDTATTESYTYLHTLCLHDALPISSTSARSWTAGSSASASAIKTCRRPCCRRTSSEPGADMNLPENAFKKAILSGRQQIGLWCMLPGSFATEALAGAGFDWLLLDTEHSPADVLTVLPQLQAAAAYAVSAVVRPASNDPEIGRRLLACGAPSLLFPSVQSAEWAEGEVDAMR